MFRKVIICLIIDYLSFFFYGYRILNERLDEWLMEID